MLGAASFREAMYLECSQVGEALHLRQATQKVVFLWGNHQDQPMY